MKILFFDIDGTLADATGRIPDSAVQALKKAHKKGHKLYICSGRNMVQVPSYLIETGLFDGFVVSAGAEVICLEEGQQKIIFEHTIEREPMARMLEYFKQNGIVWLLQSEKAAFVTEDGRQIIGKVFCDLLKVPPERSAGIMNSLLIDEHPELRTDIEKLVYYNSPHSVQEVQENLGDYFEVQPYSFGVTSEPTIGEILVRGYNKALGMSKVLEYYGVDVSDSVAFGDGPNDLEMMEYAGYSVCMGNGRAEVKALADMVTDDINEDGIYHAMEKLNLI